MTTKFDLLLFDLDGTLADTAIDIAHAANAAVVRLGHSSISEEAIRGYIGGGARTLLKRCLQTEDAATIEEAYGHFADHYGRHLLDHTTLFDGVANLLFELKGVRKAVVTNKPEPFSRRILEALGIMAHFDDVVGGDTFPHRKPDPGGVNFLRDKYAVARERTLFIGDSIIDVETARAAGVKCCLVTYGYPKGGERELADMTVDKIGDILPLIR